MIRWALCASRDSSPIESGEAGCKIHVKFAELKCFWCLSCISFNCSKWKNGDIITEKNGVGILEAWRENNL
jgi:hypothetical protein